MDVAPGIDDRYFEDYVPGSVHEFGHVVVDGRPARNRTAASCRPAVSCSIRTTR
jgi:hypothetical protein